MMVLSISDIQPNEGSNRKRLRKGRGRASGAGKTSNRGHNGEGQRSGRSSKRGFEGGQMPLYRRIPKFRTFPRMNVRQWMEINVGEIHRYLPEGETNLTYEGLLASGKMHRKDDGVRILGTGTPQGKFTIQCHYITPSAKEKLEAAGGKVELVEKPLKQLLAQ
jgi:large subunit ribosomal protein L15